MAGGLAVALGAGWVLAANPPFGGDDSGFDPPAKSALEKCENRVSKAASKLVDRLIKCHSERAVGKTTDDAGEDACEDAAITKFTTKTNTAGCDPCVSLAGLATLVETQADLGNVIAYCQSPSGAFLEY